MLKGWRSCYFYWALSEFARREVTCFTGTLMEDYYRPISQGASFGTSFDKRDSARDRTYC